MVPPTMTLQHHYYICQLSNTRMSLCGIWLLPYWSPRTPRNPRIHLEQFWSFIIENIVMWIQSHRAKNKKWDFLSCLIEHLYACGLAWWCMSRLAVAEKRGVRFFKCFMTPVIAKYFFNYKNISCYCCKCYLLTVAVDAVLHFCLAVRKHRCF